jgi:hypothetical protein
MAAPPRGDGGPDGHRPERITDGYSLSGPDGIGRAVRRTHSNRSRSDSCRAALARPNPIAAQPGPTSSSASKRANTSQVDRIIRETAIAQGCAKSPVIKWLADPSSAFDHLSEYGLDALLQMGSASLWRRAGPSPVNRRSNLTGVNIAGRMTERSFSFSLNHFSSRTVPVGISYCCIQFLR